ncbi:histone deacetylase [bacterium]|nr:histone deacetylase [bacterium]
MNKPLALYTDTEFLKHETGGFHPENPDRLRFIEPVIDSLAAEGAVRVTLCPPLSETELTWTHDSTHVALVKTACRKGPTSLDADTHVAPASWDAALRAAGAVVEASRKVLDGTYRRAFCAVRPPGHHAESDRAMGFCLFNNVALAAEALKREGLERIAIVDFDVHHGNGTQRSFWNDPAVFYASCHQYPHYPGTGAPEETGGKDAPQGILNEAMPAGAGDLEYLAWHMGPLAEALRAFGPQFLLVSAGFDSHADDPLAEHRLSTEGFGLIGRVLVDLAEELCEGKLVAALEGGYHPRALPEGLEAFLREL